MVVIRGSTSLILFALCHFCGNESPYCGYNLFEHLVPFGWCLGHDVVEGLELLQLGERVLEFCQSIVLSLCLLALAHKKLQQYVLAHPVRLLDGILTGGGFRDFVDIASQLANLAFKVVDLRAT